ncbi:site-specific integrase, partial [Nonomuraea angiospora]
MGRPAARLRPAWHARPGAGRRRRGVGVHGPPNRPRRHHRVQRSAPTADLGSPTTLIDTQDLTLAPPIRKQRVPGGFVFTDEIGRPLHPQQVSDQFYQLAFQVGLPPVRLHDLRHGAASLMLAAGVDLKVVQETLGHVSSTFTRDTYTSVYP